MTELRHKQSSQPKTRGLSLKRILEKWPFVIWLAVVAIAVFTYKKSTSLNRIYGEVDTFQISISPYEDGRLEELLARIGDDISIGQPLVKMKSDKVGRDRARIMKRLEKRRVDLIDQHLVEVEILEREIQKEEIDLVGIKTENKTIANQIKVLESLLKVEETSQFAPRIRSSNTEDVMERVSELKPDLSKNEAKLERISNKIVSLEADIQQKKDSLKKIRDAELNTLANLEEKFDLDLLDEEKKSLILKASHDGTLLSIKKEVGEYVKEGETVLDIQVRLKRVRAYMPEHRTGELEKGEIVWVASTAVPDVFYRSEVISVGDRIKSFPFKVGRFRKKDLRGQYVLIDCPPDAALLGGQKVLVYLEEPSPGSD